MAAARGRFPLSTDAGAATSWFQPGEVPLPDREYSTLWWSALVGLNHFYLRSVLPGLFKAGLLIVGGLLAIATRSAATAFLPIVAFGVWWAWDLIQVTTEKERVIAYGMTTPFDATTGIGQGMIVDGHTNYRQRRDFVSWQLMSALGPLGVDALLQGRPGLFIRKLIDTSLFTSYLSVLIKTIPTNNNALIGVTAVLSVISGIFVLIPWFTSISSMNHPTKMFTDGIKPLFKNYLNFFSSWTSSFGNNTMTGVEHDFGFADISGEDLRKDFEIYRETSTTEKISKKEDSTTKEIVSWPLSLILGNAVTGIIIRIAMFILSLVSLPLATILREGVEGYYELANCIRTSKTPVEASLCAAKAFASSLPTTGIGPISSKLSHAISADRIKNLGAMKIGEKFSGISDATKGMETAQKLADKTKDALGVAEGVLRGKLGGAEGALRGKLGGLAEEERGIELPTLLPKITQAGGTHTRDTAPSWESVVLGATVAALVTGGAIKATVDYLVRE